jgi:hypothetical protein
MFKKKKKLSQRYVLCMKKQGTREMITHKKYWCIDERIQEHNSSETWWHLMKKKKIYLSEEHGEKRGKGSQRCDVVDGRERTGHCTHESLHSEPSQRGERKRCSMHESKGSTVLVLRGSLRRDVLGSLLCYVGLNAMPRQCIEGSQTFLSHLEFTSCDRNTNWASKQDIGAEEDLSIHEKSLKSLRAHILLLQGTSLDLVSSTSILSFMDVSCLWRAAEAWSIFWDMLAMDASMRLLDETTREIRSSYSHRRV